MIELQVTTPGEFKARVSDAKPEMLRSWGDCIAEHADFFYLKETRVPGKHLLPIAFNPGECSGPNNSFKPTPLRGAA